MNVWKQRREPWKRQSDDARTEWEVDYGRVIHSASFRRLQGKTQVLNLGDSDFYRTRLTHSMEVAQIGAGIVKHLGTAASAHPAAQHLPDGALIQAIGCAHDLGHPPFGHGGEAALNYCMRDDGGFEGNGQTLRILSRLEFFSKTAGANLTRRALLGVLKYPVPYSVAARPELAPSLIDGTSVLTIIDANKCKPPKCYLDCDQPVVDWVFEPLSNADRDGFTTFKPAEGKHNKPQHKSLDCSIMEAADDIAYGVHDLEDAIALGLITEASFTRGVPEAAFGAFLNDLKGRHPDEGGNNVYEAVVQDLFSSGRTRKRAIGRLVHYFIASVELFEFDGFEEPLLKYRARVGREARALLDALQTFIVKDVVKSARVRHLEFKGQSMVVAVFEALRSDPDRLLPPDALERYVEADRDVRVVCDYVAGMTDTYLLRTYDRLFSPRMGSVFDKL